MKEKKLYRSNTDKVIGGVSAGISEYLDVDSWLVRLFFIALLIFAGSGILLYIILWIAIPEKPLELHDNEPVKDKTEEKEVKDSSAYFNNQTKEEMTNKKDKANSSNLIAGVILIVLGFLFIIDKFVKDVDFGDLWPVLLIALGIILVTKAKKEKQEIPEIENKEDTGEKTTFEEGAEDAFK